MEHATRIVMCEDDPLDARALMAHVDRYGRERGLELRVNWLRDASGLAEAIPEADLVLMDIEMPGIDGMDAARLMRVYDADTPLMFVTNLAQYAVSGYEVDALDFLVKPVGYFDFSLRMDRAMRRVRPLGERTLLVSAAEGTHVLRPSDIDYVESSDHDLVYHLGNGDTITSRGSLRALAKEVEGSSLLKISNRVLVNMECVESLRGSTVRLFSGKELDVSRSNKKNVAVEIARYLGDR